MVIKSINNDEELSAALRRLDEIFDAEEGTPEDEELEILSTLIEEYENKYYPIDV